MVEEYRRVKSLRKVGKKFKVYPGTVSKWVKVAKGKRLDRVDFADRSKRPNRTTRTEERIEGLVLEARKYLREESVLGEFGATAIYCFLREEHVLSLEDLPSIRTIGRILERKGVLDGRHRRRRPPPPRGWYIRDVCAGKTELESFDFIEDLKIEKGPLVDVFTSIGLHDRHVGAWPNEGFTSAKVAEVLIKHWKAVGLPDYAQFDNDTRFQGPHQFRDTIGRVSRVCMSLGVTPVFSPPREHGIQNDVESFNSRYQEKVWKRYHHSSIGGMRILSEKYIEACNERERERCGEVPRRRSFPRRWHMDLKAPPLGQMIYLRRANNRSEVDCLGWSFQLADAWPHRLVRCEIDLKASEIQFYGLRRRAPQEEIDLGYVKHDIPDRR